MKSLASAPRCRSKTCLQSRTSSSKPTQRIPKGSSRCARGCVATPGQRGTLSCACVQIEAAYDVLFMQSMRRRVSGDVAVPGSVRYADVPKATPSPQVRWRRAFPAPRCMHPATASRAGGCSECGPQAPADCGGESTQQGGSHHPSRCLWHAGHLGTPAGAAPCIPCFALLCCAMLWCCQPACGD
jgi:hypothetical protein